jgi:beta-phosphoglucomutase-like phosphatase (HAD superfamily)
VSWPAAALFDLDGTLIDREPLFTEAVRRVAREAGAANRESAESYVGRSWVDVYVGFGVEAASGWSFDEFMARVSRVADGLSAGGFPVRVLEGARPLMQRLRSRRVPVAIVTGSMRHEVGPALELVGVADLVTIVVAAEDYSPGKPDPAGYLHAAHLLDVDATRCVAFEDSTAGIASARAAGMVVVANADANPHPDHAAHQDHAGATFVVATLVDVTDAMMRRPS